MKKFLCNLIVPAAMFASLLTLPLWADKPAPKPAATQSDGVVQSQAGLAGSADVLAAKVVAERR